MVLVRPWEKTRSKRTSAGKQARCSVSKSCYAEGVALVRAASLIGEEKALCYASAAMPQALRNYIL
ncbi:MAG: hypothetical protein V7L20_00210 [Nostoc sp.]|uniref:hypothetical protein n=1 Tax=Nostoc sp. TaxID=1180 RepID=UPI002FF4EDAA